MAGMSGGIEGLLSGMDMTIPVIPDEPPPRAGSRFARFFSEDEEAPPPPSALGALGGVKLDPGTGEPKQAEWQQGFRELLPNVNISFSPGGFAANHPAAATDALGLGAMGGLGGLGLALGGQQPPLANPAHFGANGGAADPFGLGGVGGLNGGGALPGLGGAEPSLLQQLSGGVDPLQALGLHSGGPVGSGLLNGDVLNGSANSSTMASLLGSAPEPAPEAA